MAHTKDYIALYFQQYTLKSSRMLTTVDFYDDQAGMVRAICELVIRRNPFFPDMPDPWMAECTVKEVKGVLQRQMDIRARVHIGVMFESENHGDFYGIIRNISAGGLFVVTNQPLNRDEMISFRYTFRNIERTFNARALRSRRTKDGEFGYGCCFVGLSEQAEAVIREYVYKVLKDRERGKKQ